MRGGSPDCLVTPPLIQGNTRKSEIFQFPRLMREGPTRNLVGTSLIQGKTKNKVNTIFQSEMLSVCITRGNIKYF